VLQSPAKECFFGRERVWGGSGSVGRRACWHVARSRQPADRHRGSVLLSLLPACRQDPRDRRDHPCRPEIGFILCCSGGSILFAGRRGT